MQNYIDLAAKNGVSLIGVGDCQFCGSKTERGIHECVEIFSLGFQAIDYSKPENHLFRFISVDAHTLQHPEIHGRWSNHFHLTRQHLMFYYNIKWNYMLSPKLSDHLNNYKIHHSEEYLEPPAILKRGRITTTDVLDNSSTESNCQKMIDQWGRKVYDSWSQNLEIVNRIAQGFLRNNNSL
ncbi:MAG: hypothetical protein Mars2KO_07840 [Maribacter sp.]